MEIEFDVRVERPVEKVFGYLTDPSRLHEWQVQTVRVEQLGDGPLGVGTRLREVRRVAGRELAQVAEVVEYEPPRRFALRVDEGAIPSWGRHVLEPDGGATLMHVRVELRPRGPARLLAPLLRPLARRTMRGHYERLRANLEGGSPSTVIDSPASGPDS